MKTAIEQQLKPLRRRLGLLWMTGWSVCVLSLGLLAIFLKHSLDQQDLDARLSLYATATYGLAWFDTKGKFHDELLRRDEEILDAPFDIWVVEPGSPPIVHWQPTHPRFLKPNLGTLARQILADASSFEDPGYTLKKSGLRLQTAQVFQDGREDLARAAVLVLGDPQAFHPLADPFVQGLASFCILLLFGGFGLGLYLARRNLQPVVLAFTQREKFLVAAAHELRTPLSTLKALAETTANGEETAAERLSRVNQLATKTSLVVDDLLLFAQLDAGTKPLKRQPVRVDLLAESALPEGLTLAYAGGAVEMDLDPHLFTILLRNAFANALRYGEAATKGLHLVLTEDSFLLEDHGPGFSLSVLEEVHQGHSFVSSQGGVGLGLTILRLIVNLHGGVLILENTSEGGACIKILNLSPRLR